MSATAQWTYTQREPLSWVTGALMGIAVMWGLSGAANKTSPMPLTEMTAMLDMPVPPTEPIPTPTPRPQALPQQTIAPMAQSAPAMATQIAAASSSVAPTETPVRSLENKPSLPVTSVAAPVLSPPAPMPVEPAKPSATAGYEAQLLAYLERIKRYPTSREARLSQPQGVVKLWLDISRSGALVAAGLLNSSGSNILDSEALRTVRTAQFPPFSEQVFPNETSHRFSVSLKYQIEGQ
jgi:protein TonB